MTARLSRQHIAAGLGLAGATLGVMAGLTQAAAGSRIPDWTGNKSSPVVLGLQHDYEISPFGDYLIDRLQHLTDHSPSAPPRSTQVITSNF
jgi:hypothetical protein